MKYFAIAFSELKNMKTYLKCEIPICKRQNKLQIVLKLLIKYHGTFSIYKKSTRKYKIAGKKEHIKY